MNTALLLFLALAFIICVQQAFILFLLVKHTTTVKPEFKEPPFECFIEQDTGKYNSYY